MSTPPGAIVIAAHNEEASIGRCLLALQEAVTTANVQVIVVCKGCTDATATVARGFAGVTIVELDVASKTAALRAGDRIAANGPRIYLDADVVLTSRAAVDVLTALSNGAIAGRPPLRFDYGGATATVRRWYTIRQQLPFIQRALWGAGCYALSVPGRARFDEFPDLVSDDLFIDSLFTAEEVTIVATDPVGVRTPRKTADLLRILRRTYRTQSEVVSSHPAEIVSSGQRGQLRDLGALLRQQPLLAFDVAVYVSLIFYARIRARLARSTVWERDNSSRAQ